MRQCRRSRPGRAGPAPAGVRLAEERQHVLRRLVGDRERLDAELLLGLQRGEAGRGLLHVRVDQRADAVLQRVGLLRQEGVLRLDAGLRRAEGRRGGVGGVEQRVDGVEVVVGVVGQGERRAERLEVLRGDRQLLGGQGAGVVADDRDDDVLVGAGGADEVDAVVLRRGGDRDDRVGQRVDLVLELGQRVGVRRPRPGRPSPGSASGCSATCSAAVRATPTMAEAEVSDSPSFL